MSSTAVVTPAQRATAPVVRRHAAPWLGGWLDGVAFKIILVSFGTFVVTSAVSLLGFLAVLADQVEVATVLAPILPLSGAITAGTFLTAALLHLAALLLRHRPTL